MATIRIELLRKRFEMLARDLGWRLANHDKPVATWEGCYALCESPLYVTQYTGPTGGERYVTPNIMSRKEMLAWIEGAECAAKAMTLAYEGEPGKSPASSAMASWSADKQAELDYYKTKYSHDPKG